MNLLVDTHALIWFITDDQKLPAKTKDIMLDPENVCYASIASFWEIGIKSSLDRIELHDSLNNIFDLIGQSGFIHFPIKKDHIIQSANLSFHHRDPFDRLLIGQSISENLTMLTKDRVFHQYPVTVVWD